MDRRQKIIMNFTIPPSLEDIEAIAQDACEGLPEELMEFCENLVVQVEDIVDELTETEMEINDPYELIALYRNGKQISPGVESKVAQEDDVLILYRRALLDYWCETQDDLNVLIRQVIIEELGHHFEFSEDELDEMVQRHFQGML